MTDNIHPQPIAKHAYIDSVAIWFVKKPSNKELVDLAYYCGTRIVGQEPAWWDENYRCRLLLHQPEPEAFILLDEIAQKNDYCLNMVHIALDLITKDIVDAYHLDDYLHQRIVKLWHGKQKVIRHKSVRYSSESRKTPNQIDIYSDLPSKIDWEPCAHVEWRTQGTSAVKRMGVYRPSDLLEINYREFWIKRLILETVKVKILGRQYNQRGYSKIKIPLFNWRGQEYGDKDLYTGKLLCINAQTEIDGPTAQEIRDKYSRCKWCRIGNVMKRQPNEPFLPEAQ